MEATILNNIGLACDMLGDLDQALAYYEQALPLRRTVGERAGESVTLYNMAKVYEARGDYAKAAQLLKQVVEIDQAIEHPDLEKDRAALQSVLVQLSQVESEDRI